MLRTRLERFAPPVAVLALVAVSSDFWRLHSPLWEFPGWSVWLVRFLVVGLCVCTAVLTPRSTATTRGVGYVFAFCNAIGFVMGLVEGAGPTLAHDMTLYNTAVFLSVAAYSYRDITTRRARSGPQGTKPPSRDSTTVTQA